MEVVGAAAAISQLLTQAMASARLAHEVYDSFQNAPVQLDQIGKKFDMIRAQLEQMREFGRELSGADMDHLFPEDHRVVILAALERSIAPMNELRSLKASSHQSPSMMTRLSWATVDKRRAKNIVHEVSVAKSMLDDALQILGARLGTLNYTSLGAIRAGQDALHRSHSTMESSFSQLRQSQTHSMLRMEDSIEATRATRELIHETLMEQRHIKAQQHAQQEAMEMMMSLMAQHNRSLQDFSQTQTYMNTRPALEEAEPLELLGSRKVSKELTTHAGRCIEEVDDADEVEEVTSRRSVSQSCNTRIEPSQSQWSHQLDTFGQYSGKPFSSTEPWSLFQQPLRCRSQSYSAARIQLRRKVRGKRIDTQMKFYLHVFSRFVFHSELCIRTYANTWLSMPWVSASMSAINIRPADAPIFTAIRELDMGAVRGLLETGEASIKDVSDGEGHTLLGTLVSSTLGTFAMETYSSGFEEDRSCTAKMLSYLIREGCDPNVLSETVTDSISPMAFSISRGGVRMPELLFMHGADPEWTPLIDHLSIWTGRGTLGAQVRLLQSWDSVDWKSTDNSMSRQYLIHGYCMSGDAGPIVRAIEEDGLDANYAGGWNSPLEVALSECSLEVAAVLAAYGANIHLHPGCRDGLPFESPMNSILKGSAFTATHFLLFRGANPGDTWDNLFGWSMDNEDVRSGLFSFDLVVGVALHMLYHDANCHFSHADRALLKPVPCPTAEGERYSIERQKANAELNIPEQKALWTEKGVVGLDSFSLQNKLSGELHKPKRQTRSGRLVTGKTPSARTAKRTQTTVDIDWHLTQESDTESDTESGTDLDYDREISHKAVRDLKKYPYGGVEYNKTPKFSTPDADYECNEKLGFRRAIATRRGRRGLARWPLATVYCAAVQLAGYRAEMDDDGDIWWSDDDGDRYVDAREQQPAAGVDDGAVANCPMCRDPEAWGLGGFKKREEDGLRVMREYKERKNRTGDWSRSYNAR